MTWLCSGESEWHWLAGRDTRVGGYPCVGCSGEAPAGRRVGAARPRRIHHADRQPLLPLVPGDRYVYRETDSEGTKQRDVVLGLRTRRS